MAQKTFSAEVDAWVRATKERIEAVFRLSAQKLNEEVMSRTPIDTGYLVHSWTASLSGASAIMPESRGAAGKTYAVDAGPINLVIAGAPLSATIWMSFSASYSIFVEFGTEKMAPRAMVRLAAQNWGEIVSESVREAKNAVK
jgi:hypothetical protein